MKSSELEALPFEAVQAICEVIAQTDHPGLTGAEIDRILNDMRLGPRDAGNKRHGLLATLIRAQNAAGNPSPIVGFLRRAMNPISHVRWPSRFEDLRSGLNEVLVFQGLTINDRGQIALASRATTHAEGAKLAGRLTTELRRRNAHEALFKYCAEELVSRSLFHGLSEAAKSIPARVREVTGLAGDGAGLYDQAFGAGRDTPLLAINSYRSDSDISEQRGFKNLLAGIHGHYRNPRAHSSRIDSDENLADFFDAMSLFSYVHRRLDTSKRPEPRE